MTVEALDDFTSIAIHPSARVDGRASLAQWTTVGAEAVIEAGAVCGVGVYVGRSARVGPSARIGARAVLVDTESSEHGVVLEEGAEIGSNATIMAGIVVGAGAHVRPGAVVTRSIPPAAIVEGNPAIIIGYVATQSSPVIAGGLKREMPANTVVRGVTLHEFPIIRDLRGGLSVGEFERDIPFKPLRYFMVFEVPSKETRGEHAHKECHQFLLCVNGSCAVVADDGRHRLEVTLDTPNRGIYLPPMTWGIQYKYSADALLLVFASHHYDAQDYIRDYREFLDIVQAMPA